MGVGNNFKGLQTPHSYSSGGGLHPFRGSIRPQQTFIAKVSTSKQQAGFYSIYFHVLKKDGDLRPILDLRRLKHSLENPDLQDAPDKAHSRVNRAGRVVHYDRLKRCVLPRPNLSGTSAVPPFCLSGTSLSISPRVFRVMAAALALFPKSGLRIIPYLDNWLVSAPSRQQVVKDTVPHSVSFSLSVSRST